MTRINVKRREDGIITECQIDGHSGFDDHGFDIVCAAVSALSCTAIMGLQRIAEDQGIYNNEAGYCIIKPANAENESVQIILETMLLGLKEISKQYNDFVKVYDNGR